MQTTAKVSSQSSSRMRRERLCGIGEPQLWTLKVRFHKIFPCHKIFFFFWLFFNHLTMSNILSFRNGWKTWATFDLWANGLQFADPCCGRESRKGKTHPVQTIYPWATGPFVLGSSVFKEHHYTFSLHLPQNPTHAKISLNGLGITKKVVVT